MVVVGSSCTVVNVAFAWYLVVWAWVLGSRGRCFCFVWWLVAVCVVRMVVGREGAWAFRGGVGTGVVFSVLGLVLRLGFILVSSLRGGVNFGFGILTARANLLGFDKSSRTHYWLNAMKEANPVC